MIAVSVKGKNENELIAKINMVPKEADAVEVRLDYANNNQYSKSHNGDSYEISKYNKIIGNIINNYKNMWADKKLIIALRGKKQGGRFEHSDTVKFEVFKKSIALGADYIDMEHDFNLGYIKKLLQYRKNIRAKTKIIISYHNLQNSDADFDGIYGKLKKYADAVKIVTYANKIEDNIKMINFLKKHRGKKIIGFCMGKSGSISRILCLKYGSLLTYACLDREETAPGQYTADELLNAYNINSVNDKTKVFAVIGNPVEHSLSPEIHNHCYSTFGLNNVFVKIKVEELGSFIRNYRDILSGFSVTVPHKSGIIKHLNSIELTAKKIGAVNTVALKNGKFYGYNTDIFGAVRALKQKISISGKDVLMFGAGGAGKAIGYGIKDENGRLTIVDRATKKGKVLAKKLGCDFIPLKKLINIKDSAFDIIINATSAGMKAYESVVPGYMLKKGRVVFDIVYGNNDTKLIADAKKKKCITIDGKEMLLWQAVKQFRLLTGRKAAYSMLREALP